MDSDSLDELWLFGKNGIRFNYDNSRLQIVNEFSGFSFDIKELDHFEVLGNTIYFYNINKINIGVIKK